MGVPVSRQVPGALQGGGLPEQRQVALVLGPYDKTLPLTIDPVLSFSTYLGGNGQEANTRVALDGAGNVWVAGSTVSPDFPTTAGALDRTLGLEDVFLAKFDPTGANLLAATYLGGSESDGAGGLAVDPLDNVCVAGSTRSTDFPTASPLQASHAGGNEDAFLARLSPDGSSLLYSTYLGGNGLDGAAALAVDAAGGVTFAGYTRSSNFPTANPVQAARSGARDAFVARLNPAGSALVFSTYLGGSSDVENAMGIALDAAGNVYAAGTTGSGDFPTTPGAFDRTANGGDDAFVTCLDPAGVAIYSTYLGCSGSDAGRGIAVDAAGSAVVAGGTASADFPLTSPLQPTLRGTQDGFVARLNAAGSALVFSTYLGGTESSQELLIAVALDGAGNVGVAGQTNATDFPTLEPVQPALAGVVDWCVAVLNPTGSALLFSTFLGGSQMDSLSGIALDASGGLYVSGSSLSTDFPTASPYQAANAGGRDACLAKIQLALAPPPPPPAAPDNLTATAVSQTRIDLVWDDNAANEAGFRVERWNGSIFVPIATVGANTTTYSNTGLSPATTYRYRVIAFNAGGDSPPSNTAEATTLPNPPRRLPTWWQPPSRRRRSGLPGTRTPITRMPSRCGGARAARLRCTRGWGRTRTPTWTRT